MHKVTTNEAVRAGADCRLGEEDNMYVVLDLRDFHLNLVSGVI